MEKVDLQRFTGAKVLFSNYPEMRRALVGNVVDQLFSNMSNLNLFKY